MELLNLANNLKDKLSDIEQALVPIPGPNPQRPPPIRLGPMLASLSDVVASGDGLPTEQSYQVFDEVSASIDWHIECLDAITKGELPEFINLVKELKIPYVSVNG